MIPRVLTIAASDSSGAAGLQADLKTYEARQVYGMSAVTALTAQDSRHIAAAQIMDADFVAQQITVVLSDIGADAIKTGLLFRRDIIEAALAAVTDADALATPMIIDPVLITGDGRPLADDEAIHAYVDLLFPHALVITPNLDEAAILTGLTVNDPTSMGEAARMLYDMGPRYVLIKGGHLKWGATTYDVLYDGETLREFRSVRLPIRNARGTGCTFASCIAAEVAKGRDVPTAVSIAKQYLTLALTAAAGWRIGQGRSTVFHSTGRPPLFGEPPKES